MAVADKKEGKEATEKVAKTVVDWDLVAKDIRAGILTDRQIGEKYGRSHGAIQKYYKKHGIERNLTARIQQRTETKVAKNTVAKLASQEVAKLTQDQTIEFASEVSATIIIRQQGRIARHLAISQSMIAELEHQTINADLYENLGEMMQSPDERGMDRLHELYKKVISTSSRIDSHKKAVETEKTLIALERQAFNIADAAAPESASSTENMTDDDLNRTIEALAAKAGISITS